MSVPLAAQERDLPALVRASADQFRPVTAEQVEAARRELGIGAAELQRWLVPGSRQSDGWKSYLRWDELAPAIDESGSPNFRRLAVVYRRLTSNQPGLEQEPFRNLAAVLRRYVDLASFSAWGEDQQRFFAAQMTALATDLAAYAAEPRPRLEYVIGGRLDLLAGLGVDESLVSAVRQEYVRTNALVSVTEEFLDAAASEPIDKPGDVRDCILGTSLYGTSHTVGSLDVRPIPADDRAVLEICLAGHITSRTRGYNSPVVVRSTGRTRFSVTNSVELIDPAFRLLPSVAEATTTTQIHSVRSQRRGPLSGVISRVGTRKAYEKKARAEAIGSDHAEVRIERDFGKGVLEAITNLRRRYRDEFRYPLLRQDEYPQQVQFRSTSDAVRVELTQANRGQLGAPTAPPPEPDGHAVVGRFHQTVMSNFAAIMLGGATLSETSPDERAKLDRPLPAWLERTLRQTDTSDEDENVPPAVTLEQFQPWSITFRRTRPLTFGFADGQMMLIVHMTRFTSGRERFDEWDMVCRYGVITQDGEIVLVRRGQIEFVPTGFDPAVDRRISPAQVAIRSNLMKVVNDMNARGEGIPERIEVPVLKPRGQLEHVGVLRITHAASDDGWLTLGWDLP